MAETESLTRGQLFRKLHERGNPIRTEIQDMLTNPVRGAAERMDILVDEHPDIVNAVAHAHPVDEVPYSVHDLPPDLFGLPNTKGTFIPDSDAEIERYVDNWWPDHLQLHASMPGFHAHAVLPSFRGDVIRNLQLRRDSGRGIDPDGWAVYQEAFRRQLERGFYTLGHNAAVMNLADIVPFGESTGFVGAATGRHRTYLLSNVQSPHRIGMYIRAPIGPYGSNFAERLLKTAAFMCAAIDQDSELREQLRQNTDTHLDIVENHTTRGKSNRAIGNGIIYSNADSTVVATQEGIISLVAMANLMTPEIIDGHEDPDQLLVALFKEHDMADRLTHYVSLGTAGVVAAAGVFYPGLMNGPSSFSAESMGRMATVREALGRRALDLWVAHAAIAEKEGEATADKEQPIVSLGLPCPAAGLYTEFDGSKTPGIISRLSPTFVRVYNTIAPSPSDRSGPVAAAPWDLPRIAAMQLNRQSKENK